MLAIVLTLWRLEMFGDALVILLMLSVGGVYLYVTWQEKKQQQEAERRRQEMYARNRAYHEKLNRTARPDEASSSETGGDSRGLQEDIAAANRPAFRFHFSLLATSGGNDRRWCYLWRGERTGRPCKHGYDLGFHGTRWAGNPCHGL